MAPGTGNVTADVEAAVAVLRRGGLVAFPTETVYGLGADALDPRAVARIFAVKGRPADHPLIVHGADLSLLDRFGHEVPAVARRAAEACWPGPLTVLVPRAPVVPDVVTGGRETVGLRVPAHPVALDLLARFGGGVAAPSANRFGRVSPTTAAHVVADLDGDVDLVLDGGPCAVGVESTILDCTGSEPEVVRLGGVPLEVLTELLGAPPRLWRGESPARAPGMLASHYAPRARIELCDDPAASVARAEVLVGEGHVVGALAPQVLEGLPPEVVELEPAGPADEYARVVYDRLRQADRLGLEVLVVVPPHAEGIGRAVRDRLQRAAAATTTTTTTTTAPSPKL